MRLLHRLLRNIIGAVAVTIYTMGTIIIALSILIIGALTWIFPIRSWRHMMTWVNLFMPLLWRKFTNGMMNIYSSHQWHIHGDPAALNKKRWYLIIANHQTWLDILILGRVFDGRIPVIKFFMKQELLWQLPVVGLACWLLGYPFVRRHSLKDIRKNPALKNTDIETIKKSCDKFKEFPTAIASFVEGTRHSTKKAEASPFQYLLQPKAGGAAMVSKELSEYLDGILNVTIHYSHPATFWQYFRGDSCAITVYYELIPLTPDLVGNYNEDRNFRRQYQAWLEALWKQKDALLARLSEK